MNTYSGSGDQLYITQCYRKRILRVDDTGKVCWTSALPHEVCGCVVVDGRFFLVTTDDEETTNYSLTQVDARGPSPVNSDVARIGFAARSSAFDAQRFWSNHRERNEIVAFAILEGIEGHRRLCAGLSWCRKSPVRRTFRTDERQAGRLS